MSRPLWPYSLALCLAFALRVASQTSNVTTCVADYTWSLNSKGQTPCLIAAYLETLCGVPTSVDAIPVGTHYLGPAIGQSTVCLCSSVTYSAVSACGGCQGRTFQNWTTWSGNCASVEVSSFPKIIPAEVVVPGWMYVNITLIGNNFDPKVAQQVLNGAPSPSLTTTSIASTTSSSTASSSTLTSATAIPAQQGASKKSNAGAIAGGTIAGLVVLAVIGLYILWRVMQKRRNAVQKDLSFDSSALVAPSGGMYQQFTGSTGITQPMSMSHSTSPSGPSPTPTPYGNPSIYDARTSELGHSAYPLSPVTASSGIYTSPGPARRSLESVSPSLVQLGGYQNPSQPRGYRGAAELS